MNSGSARRGRLRVVLAGAAFAVALLVVEVGLRTVGGVFHDRFTMPDNERGWVLRPGFAGWMSYENAMWVRINSDGLRDRERSLVATPGTLRVAMLGDSYVQGINVPLEKTLPAALEDSLGRCAAAPGRTVEVLNFGVSGYGTAQELLTFRHHAAKYRPDVVLLAVYTGNDIFNNHRDLNPTSYPEQSPYFTLNNGQLELDASFRDVLAANVWQPWWRRWRIRVTDRVRTAQLLYEGWGQVRPYLVAWWSGEGNEEDNDESTGEELPESIYQPATVPQVVDAWRVTEALLLTLAREVRATGAQFWVVTLANRDQMVPNLEERREQQEALGVDSLYYPDRRIRDFALANTIPVITLAERLADYAATTGAQLNGGYSASYPLGSGHMNEEGNRVSAAMISEALCASSPATRPDRPR